MSLVAGTMLGPYEIRAPIGKGGMGEVYRARDSRLGREVAIKISTEQFSERFEREARAIAALNHPNICQLYDVGPNYLVMELVEGSPLKGPLPIQRALEYAGQILDALDAAHQKGITHRDLKPANILVTKQGIKLLDFGLAKLAKQPLGEMDATLTRALTSEGNIVGTLQYMSPEQLQGKEADARSDIFSFGCVLYEVVTGKRAFDGASAASVIAAVLEREPAPFEATSPLERVLRRSLAKDPDQRFQTTRDLKAALNWSVEQPAAPAVNSNHRWKWIALATLVLGALGGRAVVHFRQPPADDRVFRLQLAPPEGGQFNFGVSGAGGLAVSPDNRSIAYAAVTNGRIALWLQPLDGTPRMLPGTEGAGYPFWSPDSKSLGFFSAGKLQRIDAAGGTPATICDAKSGRGGAWSSDGVIIFGTLGSGLFRVAALGGAAAPLTTPDHSGGETSHMFPQIISRQKFLYYAQLVDKPGTVATYAASLAKPADRELILQADSNAVFASAPDGKGYLLWLREKALVAQEFDPATLQLKEKPHSLADPVAVGGISRQIYAAVSGTGLLAYVRSNPTLQFTWFDRSGQRLGTTGEPGEYYGPFRISPDGRSVAAVRDGAKGNDLWLLEMERGLASRFTFSTPVWDPVWSPDGRALLFQSCCPINIFRKDLAGSAVEQRVVQSRNPQWPLDWSRDGRVALYDEIGSNTGWDLWTLPITPEGKRAGDPKPYLHSGFNEYKARFSPDTRKVAYSSDESGRYEIYIDSFPEPRHKQQISTAGGQFSEWGPDGKEIFYVSPDLKLMEVKLNGDSLAPSNPRELFRLPIVDVNTSPYQISPDGRRFLVPAAAQQGSQPLNIIINWPALLKKDSGTQ